MKRRRLLIALRVFIGVAAVAVWKVTHRHDPQLVGRWMMSYDVPSTPEEVLAAINRPSSVEMTEWRLHADGTGRESVRLLPVSSRFGSNECRWWTNGDRIFLQWGTRITGRMSMQESMDNLNRTLHRLPVRNPTYKYRYAVEGPDVIRIEPDGPSWESGEVIYLTRLRGDP